MPPLQSVTMKLSETEQSGQCADWRKVTTAWHWVYSTAQIAQRVVSPT